MTETPINQEHEELRRLREVLRETTERLSACEHALLFYSHVINYESSMRGQQTGLTYQNKLKDDFEGADNDPKTLIAGRRAREYFKRYAKE